LPQNTATVVLQTQHGYIWVGTYNGIAQFDGLRFNVFDSSNSKGMTNSRVTSLHEDSRGDIWIGHDTGEVTRYSEGTFNIVVKITEWQYSVLASLMGSFTTSSNANSQRIGGGIIGTVTEVTNVIVTGITRNDGKAVRATIPSAFVKVGNISFAEDKETTVELTFNGLYTLASPRAFPGYLEIAV
jgi:hypothetical protein